MNKSEKVAIIGRNGIGKSTLFRILNNEDLDFSGKIELAKGTKIVKTEQENFFDESLMVLEYILDIVPEYRKLQTIIKNYEQNPNDDIDDIQKFSIAVNEFHMLDYSNIEDKILVTLAKFGIDAEKALLPMKSLSGGEKRFVELARILYSDTDIALLDEPTNHMDYVGKENFINWLKEFDKTIILITHDRDVLNVVNKIIDIKTNSTNVVNGNYAKYIVQNSGNTLSEINAYKVKLKEVEEKRLLVENTKILKSKTKGVHAIMKLAKKIERYQLLYEKAKAELVKPSFWIDQESLLLQDKKNIENYDKFRTQNINFQSILVKPVESEKYITDMIAIENLSLGYGADNKLIENLNLKLKYGTNLEMRGRNGSGKSTFLRSIIYTYQNQGEYPSTVLEGSIKFNPKVRLGVYEQEVSSEYLDFTLSEMIGKFHNDLNLEFNNQELSRILSNYLFDPKVDKDLKLRDCSGGQKARVQIIKMLLNSPNLIILDEPTNHLDLPSVEELENMLKEFKGCIIYVTHDNYFRKNIGGEILTIGKK